jgi:hypothetical protein
MVTKICINDDGIVAVFFSTLKSKVNILKGLTRVIIYLGTKGDSIIKLALIKSCLGRL